MTGRPGRPPKEKRTLAGTIEARRRIMAPMEERLPAVEKFERMGPEALPSVLAFVSCGGTSAEWARRAGLNPSTVHVWLWKNARDEVAKARELGSEALAEEVLRIVTEPSVQEEEVETTDADGRVTRTVKRSDAVYARKLAAWGVMELMKSWSPSRFGNRVAVDVNGTFASAVSTARDRVRRSVPVGDETPADALSGDGYPDLLT